MPKPKVDEEVAKLLKTVVDIFDKEDRDTREHQLRRYRRLKLYWNNMSQIYWSDTAQDYRVNNNPSSAADDTDQSYYDRPVNVFRAFLETIIAALSIQIPAIACVPEDADNPMDLSTAKAGNKISEQIYKQNNVVFLWLQALYIYCTEGLIACHTYVKEDEKYGTYQQKIYKDQEIESYACPNCQFQLPDEIFDTPDAGFEDDELAQMQPESPDSLSIDPSEASGLGDEELQSDSLDLSSQMATCPECGAPLDPNMPKAKLVIPQFTGNETRTKGRVCLEVYGGLYVKIANYARKQGDTPYLSLSYETHYVNVLGRYDHLRGKIGRGGNNAGGISSQDPYEQSARLNPQYLGKQPEDNVTVKNWWLRPVAFNVLEEEDCKKLQTLFPDGAMTVFANELCAEYTKEKLDDHWTLTRNPLSDYMTHEPLGELLVNIQDIVNDLISLTIQTIEHGIEQTWVDPSVVNMEGQGQLEAAPGVITATKPASGKNVSDAFYSSKPASLSPEVFAFYNIIQQLGQFVSGAMPSLFGGAAIGKTSETASEYNTSKGMALQRLQTPWRMLTVWWKEIFSKAIPAYMNEIKDDEKFVQKDDQGRYVNVFIRKAELAGKIGEVELEASEQLPVSDEQKREIIMELMSLNNEEILKALVAPENLPFVRKVVKMNEFSLPGEDDRQKQYEEISLMLASAAIPNTQLDPMSGMPVEGMTSSIPIDPDIDNHEIEAEICRTWLVSEAGRLAKIENPEGYQNVLLHFKEHAQIVQANAMAEQAMMAEQNNQDGQDPSKEGKSNQKVAGENNGKNNQVPSGK